MSNKQQSKTGSQSQSPQNVSAQTSQLSNLSIPIRQNHLSASYELLLKYEQRNFDIEDATKNTTIPSGLIQQEMKEPLKPSSLKGEQIFQKYGSMVENQPIFMKDLIFHKYLTYLPQKFQHEFSQVMLVGSGFEVAWWSSLVIVLFRSYRNRQVDSSFRQKVSKVVGTAFFFFLASTGFHQQYYLPSLKNCYYKNIKTIDTLMDRHLKILKSCGSQIKIVESVNSQPKQEITSSESIQPEKQALKK